MYSFRLGEERRFILLGDVSSKMDNVLICLGECAEEDSSSCMEFLKKIRKKPFDIGRYVSLNA